MGEAKRRRQRMLEQMGLSDVKVGTFAIEVGDRGDLDTEHAAISARVILGALETHPAAKLMLMIRGYDDDPRELWEVPEVCDYMLMVCDRIFAGWPGGSPLDLNLDDSSIGWVLACTGIVRVTGRDPSGNYVMEPM